jgi:hypothetical protein
MTKIQDIPSDVSWDWDDLWTGRWIYSDMGIWLCEVDVGMQVLDRKAHMHAHQDKSHR